MPAKADGAAKGDNPGAEAYHKKGHSQKSCQKKDNQTIYNDPAQYDNPARRTCMPAAGSEKAHSWDVLPKVTIADQAK